MNFQNLQVSNQVPWRSPYAINLRQQKVLLRAFWAVSLVALGYIVIQSTAWISTIGAIAIAIAALLPSYLWCRGIAQGIPLMPVFSLAFLWTHALPLASKNRQIADYSPAQHWHAAITVVIFLAIATLVWLFWVKSTPTPPVYYRSLRWEQGDNLFLCLLFLAILYYLVANTGLLLIFGNGGISILRGFITGLNALGVFALSYRLGRKELGKDQAILLIVFLILYLLVSASNLYLIDVLTIIFLAIIGFTIGRRQVPWKVVTAVVLICSLLHLGKGDMRLRYWNNNLASAVMPWQYPAFYLEWIDASFNNLNFTQKRDNFSYQSRESHTSILERTSLIHRLLLVQNLSPEQVPYLKGKTYTIIPELLVPRIFNQDKIRGSEGNHILSIYYGLQNYKATFSTSHAWGLLQEAYANFGLLGCWVLAIVIGNLYGAVTRWCMQTSLFSFRSLLAIIFTNAAFQTEWTAGKFIGVVFQTSIPLLCITYLLMKLRLHEFYAHQYTKNDRSKTTELNSI